MGKQWGNNLKLLLDIVKLSEKKNKGLLEVYLREVFFGDVVFEGPSFFIFYKWTYNNLFYSNDYHSS